MTSIRSIRSLALSIPATLAAVALGGCFPSFDDRPWLVDGTQVLAVRATPAEQRPSQPVTLEALVASPDGPPGTVTIDWSYCVQPRAADERTGVTASCVAGDDLESIDAAATVLSDACARFGPNPPPTQGNEPPRRPADPDATGGYYLPVRAAVDDRADGARVQSFGFVRIRCDLAGATRPIFDEYQDRYQMNINPQVGAVEFARANGSVQPVVDSVQVAPGETVDIRVRPGGGAAEPYVVYIAEEGAIFDRVEALTVSWHVTDGVLDRASQTMAGDVAGAFVSRWRAPTGPGAVSMWVVVRDNRGGSAWASFSVNVR